MTIKEIDIVVKHWKCSDGKVFGQKQAAEIHEAKLSGEIKVCTHCEGRGEVPDIGNYRYEKCFRCDGKGYLQKFSEWK